jgi:DNA-binding transcriptional regulator PaaX
MKIKGIAPLTHTILKGLLAGGLIIIALSGRPSISQIVRLFKAQNYRERYKVKRAVSNLESNGLVSKRKLKNGDYVVQLTKNGKTRAQQIKNIDELHIPKPKNWDKKWRMVTFDIPEKFRKSREEVRFRLKDLGFKLFQDSIYIYPYPCEEQIDLLGKNLLIRKHIKYVLADSIEDGELYRKRFGL